MNEFVILNGILGGINENGSIEEILGSIGLIIGHEISHSIDSSGARFDENGNYVDWWGSSAKAKFEEKVQKIRDFYDQIGVTNSLNVDGEFVDGEATADMGGVHICLEIAKKINNFDYDLFFKTYTKLWLHKMRTLEETTTKNEEDEHPFEYLRVNVTLAQFEEFHQTYHIRYGDKMYIPEEQRVAIW